MSDATQKRNEESKESAVVKERKAKRFKDSCKLPILYNVALLHSPQPVVLKNIPNMTRLEYIGKWKSMVGTISMRESHMRNADHRINQEMVKDKSLLSFEMYVLVCESMFVAEQGEAFKLVMFDLWDKSFMTTSVNMV